MTGRKGKGRRSSSARRRRRGGSNRSFRSTLVGVLILGLAGAGVWFGAQWTADESTGILRTLDRSDAVETDGDALLRPDTRVRVEVLNAGGVSGMAAAAKDELRDIGFDVVYFGNATTFDAEESEVIDRGRDPTMAAAVAETLGITSVRANPDSTGLVDVTVRLGANWQTREERDAVHRSERGEDQDEDSPAGWDIFDLLDRDPGDRP